MFNYCILYGAGSARRWNLKPIHQHSSVTSNIYQPPFNCVGKIWFVLMDLLVTSRDMRAGVRPCSCGWRSQTRYSTGNWNRKACSSKLIFQRLRPLDCTTQYCASGIVKVPLCFVCLFTNNHNGYSSSAARLDTKGLYGCFQAICLLQRARWTWT